MKNEMTSVYLDTQHLSRAVSGENNLTSFLGDSRFDFCFSITHVVESLPKDASPNPDAIARLELMMGGRAKSLAGWADLIELEKRNKPLSLVDLVVAPEAMLPVDLKLDRSAVTKVFRNELKRRLDETVLDPNIRRSLLAKFFKHGKLRPEIIRLLNQGGDTANDSADQYISSLVRECGLYDLLRGKASESQFKAKFRKTIVTPTSLGRLSSCSDMSSLHEFAKFFWQQTEELGQLISNLVDKLILGQINAGSFDYPKLRSQLKRHSQSEEFRYAIVAKLSGHDVSTEDLQHMPGTRLFVDVFWEYVFEKIDRYANLGSKDFAKALKFKRGDFADFTHLLYLPYVDIFGCDGEMKARIVRTGRATENIVTNDKGLELALLKTAKTGERPAEATAP
jgi:hypothetical protein